MFYLPIKSRLQILEERNRAEEIWDGKYLLIIIAKSPEKVISINNKKFVRFLLVVTKKISRKAVIRNKFRRRIKEAFKKIDKNLLKFNYDYQLIAKNTIFNAKYNDLIIDIENSLLGKNKKGIFKKNNKHY